MAWRKVDVLSDAARLKDAAWALYEAHGCRDKWGDLNPTDDICTCGECADFLDAFQSVGGGETGAHPEGERADTYPGHSPVLTDSPQ